MAKDKSIPATDSTAPVDGTVAAPGTVAPGAVQVQGQYTISAMEGDLNNMADAEKDKLKSDIENEAGSVVKGATAEATLKQDSGRRRRDSHEAAATFSATVTVTFPVGKTFDAAKAAIKAQPEFTLRYTVNGVAQEKKIDYEEVVKTVKDVTPNASSAATVLSTVATVLAATVAALF